MEGLKDNLASSPSGRPKLGHTRPGLRLPTGLIEELSRYKSTIGGLSPSFIALDARVIPGHNGGSVGYTYIKKVWARVAARWSSLGNEDSIDTDGRWLTPHSCRHSLNTLLLIKGAPWGFGNATKVVLLF